jgi:nitrogen regulatory protein PII
MGWNVPRRLMKLVTAIIKPFKLEEVRQSLSEVNAQGITVTEVKGFGRQQGHVAIYRGVEYAASFLPKLKIEILLPDALTAAAIGAILASARTSHIGDGKVFVTPVEHVIRVRTGEIDEVAI